jgi:hypothetical protein
MNKFRRGVGLSKWLHRAAQLDSIEWHRHRGRRAQLGSVEDSESERLCSANGPVWLHGVETHIAWDNGVLPPQIETSGSGVGCIWNVFDEQRVFCPLREENQ